MSAMPAPVRHHLLRAADVSSSRRWPSASAGLRRAELVGEASGSVHMALGWAQLDGGGHVDTHVHSHEESFYVRSGEPILIADGVARRLAAGSLRRARGRRRARLARRRATAAGSTCARRGRAPRARAARHLRARPARPIRRCARWTSAIRATAPPSCSAKRHGRRRA